MIKLGCEVAIFVKEDQTFVADWDNNHADGAFIGEFAGELDAFDAGNGCVRAFNFFLGLKDFDVFIESALDEQDFGRSKLVGIIVAFNEVGVNDECDLGLI